MTAWCLSVLHKKLKPHQIRQKVQALEEFSEEEFQSNHGCFTLEWLRDVLRKIDELWYNCNLMKEVTKVYGGLYIHSVIDEIKVAGYVMESDDRKSIYLRMNRNLFHSLFNNNENGYHSGGLLCKNKLNCFLHVLLHETVHIVLTLCDRTGHRKEGRDHGKDFNRIVKNLFGQTDAKHGLIQGYDQYHDLVYIKQQLQPGKPIQVFIDGDWLSGHVKQKKTKWVDVECDNGESYTVHAGLIRLPPSSSS